MTRSPGHCGVAILVVLALAGCAVAPSAPEPAPTVILVSIDGFRWDFRQSANTPFLDQLAASGASARKLVPIFPSKTFPNHYTLVTGLYAENHGLVANNMYDPVFDASYGLSKRDEVGNGRWYSGTPIWVSAEREGYVTAPIFWPGSEAEIGGIRPSHWEPFNGSTADETRVDMVLDLLDAPEETRPSFLTLYFDTIDHAAHTYGPGPSEELSRAVEIVDSMIGRLLQGLDALGVRSAVDVIVVSDHGMSANSRNRVIFIDDYLDLELARPIDWDPVLALWPAPEHTDQLFAQIAHAHPHLKVYRKADIPAELHYRSHRRIPPIIALADDGWAITTRQRYRECADCFTGGSHGFDPRLESMGGLFIAAGPSFRPGARIDEIENIHLYELMCKILRIEAAPNDGSIEAVATLLAQDP